jgi:hypothetical protein
MQHNGFINLPHSEFRQLAAASVIEEKFDIETP